MKNRSITLAACGLLAALFAAPMAATAAGAPDPKLQECMKERGADYQKQLDRFGAAKKAGKITDAEETEFRKYHNDMQKHLSVLGSDGLTLADCTSARNDVAGMSKLLDRLTAERTYMDCRKEVGAMYDHIVQTSLKAKAAAKDEKVKGEYDAIFKASEQAWNKKVQSSPKGILADCEAGGVDIKKQMTALQALQAKK